ncbi:MAG: CvpA family protein [Planctomycetes bacterium]|nr:CvpA family protein [Planctomycetota bacterium]
MLMFDALVLGLVVLAAGIGAWKGFAWQLGLILAPLAGLAAAWPLAPRLAPHLSLRAPFDRWAAFALIYALSTLAVHLAALGIRRMLERASLGAWDRHLGFVLGAAKGFLLALVFTAAALALSKDLRARIPETRAGGLMAGAVRALRPALPVQLAPWLDLIEPPQREKA